MATNNLAIRKGQCINFRYCKKADSSEVLEINLGDDFFCPECNGILVEVIPKPFPKWIIYSIIAFIVLLAAGILMYFIFKEPANPPSSPSPTPFEIIIVE